MFGASFGGPSAPASPFGASSTPAFGASSSSLFGGQQSSPSLFGQTSTPSLFGQSSSPSVFGASSPSLFGGASSAAQQTSPFTFGGGFGTPAASSAAFGASPLASPAPSPSQFGGGAIVPFQGQPQLQQQQQRPAALNAQTLVTANGQWANHSTKFADLHPEGQKELRRLE